MACGYHTAPATDATQNEMKSGWRDIHMDITLPHFLSIENPPVIGGIILLKRGGMWISHRLVLVILEEIPPK